MAFVDLARNRLVLKVILAGPPAVGKSERLWQIGGVGSRHEFGSSGGSTRMATLPLDGVREGRAVEIEVYEWHGPERADVRAKGLFVGVDGVTYLADAREDRHVDTVRQLQFLRDRIGKTKLDRLPGLLALGRMDEGLLRLGSLEGALEGPTWSHKVELPLEDAAGFIESLRLFGEVMLARVL